MEMMTSAAANKLIKKLQNDKVFWMNQENECSTYVVAVDEEPVVPEYDYSEVAQKLSEIDEKILRIKHAINLSNTKNTILVDGVPMTIDTVLVKMAQLSGRKATLEGMRRRQPKSRMMPSYGARSTTPEYCYINYDLELVKKEYETIDALISEMQMALDKYNQTVEFEVEI